MGSTPIQASSSLDAIHGTLRDRWVAGPRAPHQRRLQNGLANLLHPKQLMPQQLAIHQQQRQQSLAMGRKRQAALRRPVRQKRFHLRPTHVHRVPPPMKPDERFAPVQIRLFRAQAVMQHSKPLTQWVQQAHSLERRPLDDGCRARNDGQVPSVAHWGS
jgi:hypothetical protein